MLIRSQAGEFEIDILSFEREGDDLVMVGAMGVWQARTHISPRDALRLVGRVLSSGPFWAYVFTLPVLLLKRN